MQIPRKANKLARFERELSRHRCSYKNGANFVSLTGGAYKLSEEFFNDIFLPAYSSFNYKIPGSLVFKVEKDKPQPIFIDLDVEVRNFADHPLTENYVGFAEDCMKILGCDATVLVTNRAEVTVKKTKTKDTLRHGAHVYIIGEFSLEESVDLRKNALKEKLIEKHFGSFMLNPAEDVYDNALAERNNGLLMLGARKPKSDYGPHFLSFGNAWTSGKWERKNGEIKLGWQFMNHDMFCAVFKSIYSFVWELYTPKPKPPPPPPNLGILANLANKSA